MDGPPPERFVTQYDGLDLDFHSMPPPAANGGYPDGHDAEWPLNEPATRYFVVRPPPGLAADRAAGAA